MGSLSDNLDGYWMLDSTSARWGGFDLTNSGSPVTFTNAGVVGNCGTFVKLSSQTLTVADNATLRGSDRDFSLAGWVYLASKPAATSTMVAKNRTGTSEREYALIYNGTTDRFNWNVSSNGTTSTSQVASTFGSPSTLTWYFLYVYHDSVNNLLGISVNNGTVDTTAFATGVFGGTAAFSFGSHSSANYWDGRLDEWGFWNRILAAAEVTKLYNGGLGMTPWNAPTPNRSLIYSIPAGGDGDFLFPASSPHAAPTPTISKGRIALPPSSVTGEPSGDFLFPQENKRAATQNPRSRAPSQSSPVSESESSFLFPQENKRAATPTPIQPRSRSAHNDLFPVEAELPFQQSIFYPSRIYTTHWPRNSNVTLGYYEIELFAIKPVFALSHNIELGCYPIDVEANVPQLLQHYNFVLGGNYAIRLNNLKIRVGFTYRLPLYEIELSLLGTKSIFDTNRTLPLLPIQLDLIDAPHSLYNRDFSLGPYSPGPSIFYAPFVTPTAPASTIYVESLDPANETLYGLTGPFKADYGVNASGSQVIHLGPAKTPLATIQATFRLVDPMPLQAHQFNYQSMDHLLRITNPDAELLAMIIDPVPGPDDEAIAISSSPANTVPYWGFGR